MRAFFTKKRDGTDLRKVVIIGVSAILALVIYVLSLGPVLCLCQASASGGWDGWPKAVRVFYAPLRSWITSDFDTVYGRYVLWWINLQYWRHW